MFGRIDTRTESPDDIIIPPDRLRTAINDAAVVSLMESIQKIGQQCPITVRWEHAPDQYGDCGELILIAGRHRLEACRRLGIDVNCVVFYGTEAEARMWEIAENLHRAELTVRERAEHIEEWRKLAHEAKVRQLDAPGGKQPSEQGIRETSRALDVPEPEVRRASKIANLSPEAKDASTRLGYDDNQSALLAAARHAEPAAQVAALQERAERKRAPREPEPALEPDAFSDGPMQVNSGVQDESDGFGEWVSKHVQRGQWFALSQYLSNVHADALVAAIQRLD